MATWIWIAVAVLGGSFSVARFLVDAVISERTSSDFPWGTFVINVTGSFVLGWFVGASLTGTTLLLVGTASIGSYTTFSTWMFETHRLAEDDDRRPLVVYLVASLLVGLAAAGAGHILGRTL